MFAYLVTNKVSGKQYVGITKGPVPVRWSQHVKSARSPKVALHKAIAKYGADAFTVETIYIAETWDDLLSNEVRLIAELGTKKPNGYNLTDGGEGAIGVVISAETRKKQSIAKKGIRRTAVSIARQAASRVGYRHSEATKAKIGAAHKGRAISADQIRKMLISRAGYRVQAHVKEAASRPVIAGGVEYSGVCAAAEALGVSAATIARRIEKGVAGYKSLRPVKIRIKRSPEFIERMRQRSGRSVVINGERFSSMQDAADALGMTRPGIAYRLKVRAPGYEFV